jgi:hypothetical protein
MHDDDGDGVQFFPLLHPFSEPPPSFLLFHLQLILLLLDKQGDHDHNGHNDKEVNPPHLPFFLLLLTSKNQIIKILNSNNDGDGHVVYITTLLPNDDQ